jgi:hypothetical protein
MVVRLREECVLFVAPFIYSQKNGRPWGAARIGKSGCRYVIARLKQMLAAM